MSDADAVGLLSVVGNEPEAAETVSGAAAEANLHAVTEFLPITTDGHVLVRSVEDLAVTPGKRVGLTIGSHAINDDGVERASISFRSIDSRPSQIEVSPDLQVIELLACVLIGRDFSLATELRDTWRQLQRRPFHQFDLDRLIDIEDRPMLP